MRTSPSRRSRSPRLTATGPRQLPPSPSRSTRWPPRQSSRPAPRSRRSAPSSWRPDASDRTHGFTFKWTATRDGSTFASGPGATFTFTPDDDGVYTVVLEATDDGNVTGQTSLSLVVDNVPPSAQILSFVPSINIPNLILPNELITFTGTYRDPGT